MFESWGRRTKTLVSTKDLNRLYFLLASIFLFLTLTIYNQRRFRQDVL